jgi:hypothetical protein
MPVPFFGAAEAAQVVFCELLVLGHALISFGALALLFLSATNLEGRLEARPVTNQ